MDRDGDRIVDELDSCPDDPEDYDEFEDEDGCPDVDNDQDKILDIIESNELRIVPKTKRNEILAFIKQEGGLLDFSISRSRKRAGDWGIPVPGDEDQVMYVWYDALANIPYVTGGKTGTDMVEEERMRLVEQFKRMKLQERTPPNLEPRTDTE